MCCSAPFMVEAATPITVFNEALCRARRRRFVADGDLSKALGAYVRFLRVKGSSCDDAIDAVGTRARDISPRDTPPTEMGWEDGWRRYFALYDTLIRETVRAYVLDSERRAVASPR